MTDLTKAIAELRQEEPLSGAYSSDNYYLSDIYDGPKATILNAAVSGKLIPATERDAAVAAALQEAAGEAAGEVAAHGEGHLAQFVRRRVLALITQRKPHRVAG